MSHSLTILIPAYNEEKNLADLLPKVVEFAETNNYYILLIDDGSTDDSNLIYNNIKSEFLNIVSYKNNRGVGGALKAGIKLVKTEYFVTFDADGQHNIDDITRLENEIKQYNLDLVIGERYKNGRSNLYRSIGKILIRTFASLLANKKIKDLNTGLRIFRTDAIVKYLECLPDGFSFHDISSLLFILKKNEVGAIQIKVSDRKFGTSIISTKHALITLNDIINLVVLFHPVRIFLPLSIIFILLGCVWATPYLLSGKGLSVGGLLLILMGLFSFFFGILSEQLSQIRKHQLNLDD